MEDADIVELYWRRSEDATTEAEAKYGAMLTSLSFAFVKNRQDAEECVNDTWLAAWNAMPDDRPSLLGAYLSKITRRLSIKRFRYNTAMKREGTVGLTDELADCIPASSNVEKELREGMLKETLDRFLRSLDEEKRVIFVRRYFYADSVEEIASKIGVSVPKVKTTLFRVREKLRGVLEKEELL